MQMLVYCLCNNDVPDICNSFKPLVFPQKTWICVITMETQNLELRSPAFRTSSQWPLTQKVKILVLRSLLLQSKSLFFFYFLIFGGRERVRVLYGLPPTCSLTADGTRVRALTETRICHLAVSRTTLQPTEPHRPGLQSQSFSTAYLPRGEKSSTEDMHSYLCEWLLYITCPHWPPPLFYVRFTICSPADFCSALQYLESFQIFLLERKVVFSSLKMVTSVLPRPC